MSAAVASDPAVQGPTATRGDRPGAGAAEVPRVLVVTNDFPPRVGGVQQYVWNVVRHLPPDAVSVVAPNWHGWREHDAEQPFPVHRWPTTFLWPTSDLGRRVTELARDHRADLVVFGHGYPLPVLGAAVRAGGLPYVAMTHGVEVWLARAPGLAGGLRRALAGAAEVTAISRYTAERVWPAVPAHVPLTVIEPAVDPARFAPSVDGGWVRERHALGARPMILCVSRLVPRKGQDVLIRAMPMVLSAVPDAALVIAGNGPHRGVLERMAAGAPAGSVLFAGEVPDRDLPAYYAACDVFAMPCRSRWGGLEVEGFGIVFLEAAATGKAVVGGHSGGAGEAVVDEVTGLLVEGAETKAVGLACAKLLRHPDLARAMGAAGRLRVERELTWTVQAERLAEVLRRAAG